MTTSVISFFFQDWCFRKRHNSLAKCGCFFTAKARGQPSSLLATIPTPPQGTDCPHCHKQRHSQHDPGPPGNRDLTRGFGDNICGHGHPKQLLHRAKPHRHGCETCIPTHPPWDAGNTTWRNRVKAHVCPSPFTHSWQDCQGAWVPS
jgi:hypothetical protein